METNKTLDDLLNEGIIFVEEEWDEEDYWWVYYSEDEDNNDRVPIKDINQFVRDYNNSELGTEKDG